MSPRKLTEDDKQSMLKLYRDSPATTSTLATEFGVSSSTVSRFLKNSLSNEEYEELIQQKRLARTTKGEAKLAEEKSRQSETKKSKKVVLKSKEKKADLKTQEKPEAESETPVVVREESEPETPVVAQEKSEPETESETPTKEKKVRRRRRSRKKEQEVEAEETEVVEKPSAKATLKLKSEIAPPEEPELEDDEEDDDDVDVSAISAMLGEEIDDDDDDDEEEDDDDSDDDEEDYPHADSQHSLEILPLAAASLPRICYLVVDRSAELIVKPLQEFADLGAIPDTEVQQKTLPVFDNHRVAKRFSHRREKVIKVPDGKMLQKTSQYLYDKGITRVLIRGQLYEISDS